MRFAKEFGFLPEIRIPIVTVICLVGLIIIEPSVYLGLILLSVLLHETGHFAAMLALGVRVEKITVLPLGIDMKRQEKYISYPRQMLIDLAGITVNLIMFFVFRGCEFFAYTNLLYALINLLPVKGLDGGNALEALLLFLCSYDRAHRILRGVSLVFLILLWMLGVYILFILNGNISIFALSVFLFVTVIMK